MECGVFYFLEQIKLEKKIPFYDLDKKKEKLYQIFRLNPKNNIIDSLNSI